MHSATITFDAFTCQEDVDNACRGFAKMLQILHHPAQVVKIEVNGKYLPEHAIIDAEYVPV